MTIVVDKTAITVFCTNEDCCKKIKLKTKDLSKAPDELKAKGWGWLGADEMYDHVCSLKCRLAVIKQREEDAELETERRKALSIIGIL